MNDPHQIWFDHDAGPLVRPYAMVGGRVGTPGRELDLVTLVTAVPSNRPLPDTGSQYQEIIRLCGLPRSVAELSAAIGLPLFATKVIVNDLIDSGHLTFRADGGGPDTAGPDAGLLRAVLHALRTL